MRLAPLYWVHVQNGALKMRVEAYQNRVNISPATRAHGAPSTKRSTASFESALSKSIHKVESGETLSEICAEQLRNCGEPLSTARIYQAVGRVAQANNIENPNLIAEDQFLDMAALRPAAGSPSSRSSAITVKNSVGSGNGARRAPWLDMLGDTARLSSEFGIRKDPFTGQLRHHDGLDFAVAPGTRVRPFLGGEVIFAGWKSGYGNAVIVRHDNGLETLYGHNSKLFVQQGQFITDETVLGLSGNSGRSTGPHVHFEARRNGKPVDPIPLFAQKTTLAALA